MNSTLKTMIDAAIAAAAEINAVYADATATASTKADGSPVTAADARAEVAILGRLGGIGLPILAEESVANGRAPALGRRYFAVDPLDGTKEFLKRNGEFTVNIALIEDGRPRSGVLLAPATGRIYYADASGAFAAEIVGGRLGSGRPIGVSGDGPIRVVASRSHGHEALAEICAEVGVAGDVSVGSALKFGLLAEGKARLYPRLTPTSEWDSAAGQAIVEAAGGVVLAIDGAPLSYGKSGTQYLNPYFVAASDRDLAERALHVMRRVLGVHAATGR